MLFGEHGVLQGKPAIVAAANTRIQVTLTPRDDGNIHIDAGELGQLTTTIDDLDAQPPFQFVIEALLFCQNLLPSGCDLRITSEFPHTVGLGSSAAVTVACIGVLNHWLELGFDKVAIYKLGLHIIQKVQGLGSGADVAASVFGGIVAYTPPDIEPLSVDMPVSLIYCGYKTPTVDVVNTVATAAANEPDKFTQLYDDIGTGVQNAHTYLSAQDWPALGQEMDRHFRFQQQLGVSDPTLEAIIQRLAGIDGIHGAKISGSGLGDCVVACGVTPDDAVFADIPGAKVIPVTIAKEGLVCE